jgi:hypothetical protein
VKERFPWPAQSQAIFPVHIGRVELQHHLLLDKSICTAGYSTEDPGVLEFKDLCSATADLSGLSKPYVPVVLFYSGHHRPTSLSDLHLTALAGYLELKHPRCVCDKGTV